MAGFPTRLQLAMIFFWTRLTLRKGHSSLSLHRYLRLSLSIIYPPPSPSSCVPFVAVFRSPNRRALPSHRPPLSTLEKHTQTATSYYHVTLPRHKLPSHWHSTYITHCHVILLLPLGGSRRSSALPLGFRSWRWCGWTTQPCRGTHWWRGVRERIIGRKIVKRMKMKLGGVWERGKGARTEFAEWPLRCEWKKRRWNRDTSMPQTNRKNEKWFRNSKEWDKFNMNEENDFENSIRKKRDIKREQERERERERNILGE